MDTTDLVPIIERLSHNIDDLDEALNSLLKGAVSDVAAKMPLLDRAKLYVLIVVTQLSDLEAFLRLNGVDAKNHPVFRELTRVKQYFEKIKAVESGESEERRSLRLDKPAAARFIKNALSGNIQERASQDQSTKSLASQAPKAIPASGGEASQEASTSDVDDEVASPRKELVTLPDASNVLDLNPRSNKNKKKKNKKRKSVQASEGSAPDDENRKPSKKRKKSKTRGAAPAPEQS